MQRGLVWAVILGLVLAGEAWPQDGRQHLTVDAHHPRLHANDHSENGADEVKVEDLASDCSGPVQGDGSGGSECGTYTSSLPWTSITGRPDITPGTNQATIDSQNYQWQIASRSINSGVSPGLFIGRNTHTANQRAGYLVTQSRDGTNNYLWFNNDGTICKSTTAPDATDSNCESTGVDPQIITMGIAGTRGQFTANSTVYIPIFSGILLGGQNDPEISAHMTTGDVNDGVPFPAGQIGSFGFVGGGHGSLGSACEITVTVNDDGDPTDLSGTITAGDSHANTNTITVEANSLMNVAIAVTECAVLDSLFITMNFIPG